MYYITEIQHKADGNNNIITTARQSLASGLSYFYDRKSKMLMNTEFTSVSLQITDENLDEIVPHETVPTLYAE